MNTCDTSIENRKSAKEIYRELNNFFRPEKYQDTAANGLLLDYAEYLEAVYTSTFSGIIPFKTISA